jgi:hypothetical protein
MVGGRWTAVGKKLLKEVFASTSVGIAISHLEIGLAKESEEVFARLLSPHKVTVAS